jgi:hypothetical protein
MGCRYIPVTEDNLKVDNLVTAESTTGSIKGIATSSQEASDTDSRCATASSSSTIRLKSPIDISPNGTSLDLSNLCVLDIRGLVQQSYAWLAVSC